MYYIGFIFLDLYRNRIVDIISGDKIRQRYNNNPGAEFTSFSTQTYFLGQNFPFSGEIYPVPYYHRRNNIKVFIFCGCNTRADVYRRRVIKYFHVLCVLCLQYCN